MTKWKANVEASSGSFKNSSSSFFIHWAALFIGSIYIGRTLMPPTNPRCQEYSPIVGITIHFATRSKPDLITPKMRLPSTCPFAKASSLWPSPQITLNTSSLLQSFCHRLFSYVLGKGSSWHIHHVSSPVPWEMRGSKVFGLARWGMWKGVPS